MKIEDQDSASPSQSSYSQQRYNTTPGPANRKASQDEREATELGPVDETDDHPLNLPHTPQTHSPNWYDPIQRFWTHYVQLAVPHADCRDHLANERTFLAYQRTSVALSMIGIVTTQLFNLRRQLDTHAPFGYYALSKPLGALFQIAAIMVTLIGAHRYSRQQLNMARGKIQAGGWEVYAIMATVSILVTLVFIFLIVVDVNEEAM